jgi:hypothetical protein
MEERKNDWRNVGLFRRIRGKDEDRSQENMYTQSFCGFILLFPLSTLFEFDEKVHLSVLRGIRINVFTITLCLRYY